MTLTRYEKETIVRFSEDPTDPMTVFTHSKKLTKRLQRLGATLKKISKIKSEEIAWTLEMPSEWFKEPRKPKQLSTESREKLVIRGQELAAKRHLNKSK